MSAGQEAPQREVVLEKAAPQELWQHPFDHSPRPEIRRPAPAPAARPGGGSATAIARGYFLVSWR
jgi:hypothetical protein